ncbi:MAG: hypothetical protein E7353_01855 [Clostridiales bacterium]|nr:hypothetical protein [Clostridiales bacterium]
MKNKDLKNLIRSKADEIVIADKSAEILQNVKSAPNNAPESVKTPRVKRTFYAKIGAFATALVAIIIAIVLPFAFNDQGGRGGTSLTKTQQVFSKEVFALGNLMEHENMLSTIADDNESSMGEVFEPIAKKINGYLLSADAFLSSSNIVAKYEDNENEDFALYTKKLIVAYTDSDNYSVAYELYYNEKEQNAHTVTVDGIMVLGSDSFKVWGEWENEDDEVEMELRVYFDDFRYISIENETEVNENEYEYGYYNNGLLFSGVSLSVSNENGKKQIEMEIVEGGIETEITFVYDKNVIHGSYENPLFKTDFDIRHENNTYEYDFGFEFKISLIK